MSSLIGHTAAGVSVYLAYSRPGNEKARWILPAFILLAICPDFDYFAFWLFHFHSTPRITHTLFFSFAASLLAWLFTKSLRQQHLNNIPFVAFLLASLSHPFLDLLVGVHSLPLFWPLLQPDVSIPFGVLPSAGRLAIGNYYLWRNLLIELAVLLPALALIVAIARRVSYRSIGSKAIIVAPIWLAFLVWSIGLQR